MTRDTVVETRIREERRPAGNSRDNRCSFARHELHGRRTPDKASTENKRVPTSLPRRLPRVRHFGLKRANLQMAELDRLLIEIDRVVVFSRGR